MELSGELRYRLELSEKFNRHEKTRKPEDESEILHTIRADIAARAPLGERVNATMRLRAAALGGFGNAEAAFRPDEFARLHEAYIDFKPGNREQTLRAGRQELDFGRGLLISGDDWDHVGNSFDGLRLTRTSADWTHDFFATWISDPATVGRDGSLSGVNARHARRNRTITEYSLFYREIPRAFDGAAADSHFTTLGARREGKLSQRWFYNVAAHYQFGKTNTTEPKSAPAIRQRISARHFIVNADYLFYNRILRNAGVEYSSGSGDNPGTAGKSETFRQLTTGNHSRFGSMDWFGPMNADILTLYAFCDVAPNVNGLIQWNRYRLNRAGAAWYKEDGAPAWFSPVMSMWPNAESAPRDAGAEWDFEFRVRGSERMDYHFGYSVFIPGNLGADSRFWNTSARAQWAYFQMRAKF